DFPFNQTAQGVVYVRRHVRTYELMPGVKSQFPDTEMTVTVDADWISSIINRTPRIVLSLDIGVDVRERTQVILNSRHRIAHVPIPVSRQVQIVRPRRHIDPWYVSGDSGCKPAKQ